MSRTLRAVDRWESLWALTVSEYRKPRVVLHEDSWFLRTIHWALGALISFVNFFRWLLRKAPIEKRNYSRFTTTVGRTMWVPNSFWDWHPDERYRLLRHERKHMHQFRCWPFPFLGRRGIWRINAFIMGFCYLFVLPVRWTFRAKFETEGYRETMLTAVELGHTNPRDLSDQLYWVNRMEKTFSTSTYFFMAPKGYGERFARETLAGIADGSIAADPEEIVA